MSSPSSNLVIAGVTKAGTTALLHYLAQHPDICGERHKESQLLLRDDLGPEELATAYAQQFAHCRGEPWRLESSPAYFSAGPDLLERTGGPSPGTRVLVVLRDPVTRIWSAYRMKRSKGLLQAGSFEEFVANGLGGTPPAGEERLHRVFATSRYPVYLRPWLEQLDDRVLPLFLEDLAVDTPGTLRDICTWLDIDPAPVDDFDLQVHNRGVLHRSAGLHALAAACNRALAVSLRRAPGLRSGLLRLYERINTEEFPEQLDPATAARLRAAYREDTDRLRHLLIDHGHRRFPTWLAEEQHDATARPRRSPWSAPPIPTDPDRAAT